LKYFKKTSRLLCYCFLQGVWGYENEAEYNNLEVYISFTRKKLKFIQAKAQIKAVRGVGYELREEEV